MTIINNQDLTPFFPLVDSMLTVRRRRIHYSIFAFSFDLSPYLHYKRI